MSLTGNLEDLPLLDILQIVSFSKKTGYLSIRTSAGEGAIVFREGLVVASFTWDSLPVDPRLRTLPADKRAVVLRQRIEMALEHLIRLREGQFNFSLMDKPPAKIGAREIADETLDDGINPQELLLDLARGMDEERRDSTAAIEASFADVPTEAAPPAAAEDEELVEADLELQPDERSLRRCPRGRPRPWPGSGSPTPTKGRRRCASPRRWFPRRGRAFPRRRPRPRPRSPRPLRRRPRPPPGRCASCSWTTRPTCAASSPNTSGARATRWSRRRIRTAASSRRGSSAGRPPRSSSSPTSGCRPPAARRSRAGSRWSSGWSR